MSRITIRMSQEDELNLTRAAKKSRMARSEYIRQILFENGNIAEKIDFYKNINLQMKEIVKQSMFTTQMLCNILANQTDPETVQRIIENIKQKLELEEYGDEN